MPKFVFSTEELPPNLSQSARINAWSGLFEQKVGPSNIDFAANKDRPLNARLETVPLNAVSINMIGGSFDSAASNKASVAAEGSDALCLFINTGNNPLRIIQRDREVLQAPGQAAVFWERKALQFKIPGQVNVACVRLPRAALASTVRPSEDILVQTIDPDSEPLRMLGTYARAIIDMGGVNDSSTANSMGSHIADMFGLMLGLNSEARQMATQRGLRAARLQALLGEIQAGYLDPAFSIDKIAVRHRVTARYLRDLLQETGIGFAERVLELRLQKACDLLARAHISARKISDIAYSCGFNDLSYFHRCFRRRFGMTPADARSAA